MRVDRLFPEWSETESLRDCRYTPAVLFDSLVGDRLFRTRIKICVLRLTVGLNVMRSTATQVQRGHLHPPPCFVVPVQGSYSTGRVFAALGSVGYACPLGEAVTASWRGDSLFSL